MDGNDAIAQTSTTVHGIPSAFLVRMVRCCCDGFAISMRDRILGSEYGDVAPISVKRSWNMSLGKRAQTRREELGLSQAEIGERVNKDKSRISRLENDQWIPDKETLQRLALALDCTVAYLTGEEEATRDPGDTNAVQLASLATENALLRRHHESDQGMIEFLKSTIKQLLEKFARHGGG